ncbi:MULTISPECIES: caspase family protein [Chitinophagaceae]
MKRTLVFLFGTILLSTSVVRAQEQQLVLQRPHSKNTEFIRYNNYNSLLYTYSSAEKNLKIWDCRSGKTVKQFNYPTAFNEFILRPDGKTFILKNADTAQLFKDNGELVATYPSTVKNSPLGYGGDTWEVDGHTGNILIIRKDSTADILNTLTGTTTRIIDYHCKYIFHTFNAGGTLSYVTERAAYVFDMQNGTVVDSVIQPKQEYFTVPSYGYIYCSGDRRTIALPVYQKIILLRTKTHDTISIVPNPGMYGTNATFSTNLERVLCFNGKDSLTIFNTSSGERVSTHPVSFTHFESRDFIGKNLVDFKSMGGRLIFNLNNNEVVYQDSHPLQNLRNVVFDTSLNRIFFLRKDTIISQDVASLQKTFTVYSTHGDNFLGLDGTGHLYVTQCPELYSPSRFYIQKRNAVTLKQELMFPNTYKTNDYHNISHFLMDSENNVYTQNTGFKMKRWSLSEGRVTPLKNTVTEQVLTASFNLTPIILTSDYYVTAATDSLSRIQLRMYGLPACNLLKEYTSMEAVKSMDDIVFGGCGIGNRFFVQTTGNTVYEWDTTINKLSRIKTVQANAGGQRQLSAKGNFLILRTPYTTSIDLLYVKDKNTPRLYHYEADVLGVSKNSAVAYIKTNLRGNDNSTLRQYTINITGTATSEITEYIKFSLPAGTSPTEVQFSPDSRYLALAAQDFLLVWEKKGKIYERIHTDTSNYSNYYICGLYFDSAARHLYYTKSNSKLCVLDLRTNENKTTTKQLMAPPIPVLMAPSVQENSAYVAIAEEGGNVQVFDKETLSYKCTLMDMDDEEWLLMIPGGHYMCSRHSTNEMGYSIWPKYYSFNQLDIKYNRPDLVLREMANGDTSLTGLIEAYHKAYQKRIKRSGVDTASFNKDNNVPVADFVNRNGIDYTQNNDSIVLGIHAVDSLHAITKFNVWVNDVPVYGSSGLETTPKNRFDTSVSIALSRGDNLIETSATNTGGVESYRIPLYVTHKDTTCRERLYFIGIGASRFADTRYNLHWSAKDIRDMATAFRQKYGEDCVVDTLFDDAVNLDRVKTLKQHLLKTTVNDKVVVAYSGHGLLNEKFDYYLSSYNTDFSRLENGGIPYELFENLLDAIPARKKLMLIDACNSGEVDKDDIVQYDSVQRTLDKNIKGILPPSGRQKRLGMQNSFELMKQLFADVGNGTGATVISAASGTQFALEKNNLQNGVFTYSVLEYLKGHPKATVGELMRYVNNRVLELTKGKQQPTTRSENSQNDWDVW